jgi:hypothetical protein
MTFTPGDPVWVDFDGLTHRGVIEKVEPHGWLRCRILIDVLADYSSITPRLAPHSTVCVRDTEVKHADAQITQT